ncbi:MAG TPA: cytochrome C oxidase subunit II [Noviherbaspirillum sp.]|uniref:cytochrome C oxidase subunit II n=1 Tax=Noviherbaspirillum sp. TaxID=1926288 RepID=UPI002B47BF80|nr:cytochrome C oxidase subunit II [Noviherbaspirillum sp.]HJV84280.1 cytochrome C oxidase subunit II [Noviherbaspirillum sp.]
MSAIHPPTRRLWWKQPIDRVEGTWIGIAFIWCLFMFFMMPFWHVYGKQNLSNEAYRTTPEIYSKKAQAMVDKYTVRTESDQKIPVVHPPAGSDVYLVARLWAWWPILELEQGKSYRLHLSAMDYMHGFSLQPENINLQVIPGYEMVVTVTPNLAGQYSIVCNEYCGIGHHTMVNRLYVVNK